MKLRLPKSLIRLVLASSAMLTAGIAEATQYNSRTTVTSFTDITNDTINFSNNSANSSIDSSGGDLDGSNITIHQYGTPISITGGNEVTILRYIGCDANQTSNGSQNTVLNITSGTTLTIVGADNHSTDDSRPKEKASFVLAHWSGKTGTVNVSGILNVREATLSVDEGKGILNIQGGGILNIKKLDPLSHGGTVTVNMQSGSTLNIGADGIANNGNLTLNLNGGTIGIDGANGATS